jgi:hypothetical protein
MIDVVCLNCGTAYHTPEANVGKRILFTSNLPGRQQKCGNVITIVPLAIAQQPRFSPTVNRQASPSGGKEPRSYLFAIAAVVGLILVSLALLRHYDSATQVLSKKPNIEAPTSSKASNTAGNGGQGGAVGAATRPVPQDFSDVDEFVRRRHKVGAQKDGSNQASDSRPTEYNSLPTGTRIEEDTGTGGHGELTVENGTSEDAVVRLSDVTTDQTVRWFFVQAHSSAHVPRMPPGSY